MKWVNPFQVAAHPQGRRDAGLARQPARADLHRALAREPPPAGGAHRRRPGQTLSEMDHRNHYSESLTYSFLQKGRHS